MAEEIRDIHFHEVNETESHIYVRGRSGTWNVKDRERITPLVLGLVKVIRMTGLSHSFDRSAAATFRFAEIYGFAKKFAHGESGARRDPSDRASTLTANSGQELSF